MNNLESLAEGNFKSLPIRSFYSTTGQRILKEAIAPVLALSTSYDRLTGYFTVQSLVSVASGIEKLYRSQGKMRLVIGIHDVQGDLLAAQALGDLLPSEMVKLRQESFLREVGELTDLTTKSAIAGVAWMLRLGLLEVRVAAPKTNQGIYHQKRMIFRDIEGNVIAGTGSLNETIGGLYNVEEMQFSFSWKSSDDPTHDLVESFENIWNGIEEDIEVIPLSEAFATQLLEKLGDFPNPLSTSEIEIEPNSLFSEILKLIRDSPTYAPFNLSNAALYPHQERVFSESLSRWPIRVMLADEVGLGKTLEAGIVISYMVRMRFVEDVTILCPAGLMRQWQEEMHRHFGLDFWIYESSSKSYLSPKGDRILGDQGSKKSSLPRMKLISAQWARQNEEKFTDALPEMLVVDEAHAARVNIDQYGSKSTRLWKLLDSIKNRVPHLLLLTATPMQVHASEYHGLLGLLGLPQQWQKYKKYEDSLRIISADSNVIALNEAKILSDLLLSSFESYAWLPTLLSQEELLLIMELRQAQAEQSTTAALVIQRNLEIFRNILTKVHPAHLLTCRNTKSGLKPFGYRFPNRNFSSPKIKMSGNLEKYEWAVESYLSNAYGKTEESLKPAGRFPIGFAKSGFYQRLVSSLYASRSSLNKRVSKLVAIEKALVDSDSDILNQILLDFDIDDEDLNTDEFSDLTLQVTSQKELEKVLGNVKSAVKLETSYIAELLTILDQLGENVEDSDPKFEVAMEVLENLLPEGPVLIFSRYTDTLEGFLELFSKSELSTSVRGYALYTGGDAWIQTEMGRVRATKSDVTDALNSGSISAIFCSDAASEGLNLQFAKSLINLDVPWNPARLEQRIGRIARLGQKAAEVNIVNLWYPESIEAKMYTRLLSRRSDYELAVGEAADIFSDSIRNELRMKFSGEQINTPNEFVELQRVREDFQRLALEKIWQSSGQLPPVSTKMREDLIEFIRIATQKMDNSNYQDRLSAEPGTSISFTLLHEVFDELSVALSLPTKTDDYTLCGVMNSEKLVAFVAKSKLGRFRLIKVMSLGRMLKSTLQANQLNEEDFYGTEFDFSNIGIRIQQFMKEQSNIPNHSLASVPFGGMFMPWNEEVQIEYKISDFCRLAVTLTP
jgi:SNF2 family DNA or RNA helicase